MKNSREYRYVISIISLIVIIVGGVFNYLLKDRIDIQGKEIQNEINKLDLEIRSIKNTLEVVSQKLGISSDIMSLVNDIVPKADFKYDKAESGQLKNQTANQIVHNIYNSGKYSFVVTRYKVFITNNQITEDTNIKGELIEGIDYTVHEDFSYTGMLSPGTSKPYSIKVIFNQSTCNKYNKIYVTYFVYYKTHQKLLDKIKRYTKGVLSEKDISSLSSGQTRSGTEILLNCGK